MRLQEIMSTPVESIEPQTSVAEAREIMKRQGIHHLVVASGRRTLGVVSSRDITRVSSGEMVERFMSKAIVSASPQTTVREAANLLRGRSLGCLPVTDKGRIVGMVTIADLLELLGKGTERPVGRSTRWTLRARGPRRVQPNKDRQGLAYSR